MDLITPQVLSLDPPFAIFIDLCSSDFQTVGSFTAFGFIAVSLLLN